MEPKKEKLWYTKKGFNSQVNKTYADFADRSIADRRRALINFYSEATADEDVLCKRYRNLKYDTDHSLSSLLGLLLGAMASLFITAADRFLNQLDLFSGLSWTYIFAAIFIAFGYAFIWGLKKVCMNNKVLFLYPLEMELIEQELSKDKAAQTCDTPTEPSPDNSPDESNESKT